MWRVGSRAVSTCRWMRWGAVRHSQWLKSSPRWNLTRSLPLRYNVRATQLRQSALVLDWAYSWMIDSSRSMSDVGRDNGLRTCVATILEYAAGVVSPIDYRRANGETASEVGIESLPCVRTLSRGTLAERSSLWPTGSRCGPESAGCSAATTVPHDAWAVLITVHGRLLTTCRRTSSRLEGSFLHGASWPTTVVSRCPWTSILQRGHDPLKFYESPGNGRCLGLALRAGFWALAQLVARFHGMEEVRGSNPLCST